MAWPFAVAVAVFVKNDFQLAAVRQFHAFAQAAFAAKAVEHPRNRARVLAQFGGFALETVNLLDDFDGNQDVVFFETEKRWDRGGERWCRECNFSRIYFSI